MNPEVRAMLEKTYGLFLRKFGDPAIAWDRFLEFVAVDNSVSLLPQIGHKFEWLFGDKEFSGKVMRTYDYQLMKSDFYDHLGDMYAETVVSSTDPKNDHRYALQPMGRLEEATASAISYSRQVMSVLQPDVTSGRSFMAAYKQAPNAIFFGIADDERKARLTLTNLQIHDLRGFVLHADRFKHNVDPSTKDGSHNWGFANKWHSQITKLRPASGLEKKLESQWSVVLQQPLTLKNDPNVKAPALE